MDKSIDKEIENLIRKNLPEEVGQVLKKELEELAKLRVAYADSTKMIETLKGSVKAANDVASAHANKIKELEATVANYTNIEKREKDIVIAEAINKVKLECADLRIGDMKGMMHTIFRNTEIREQVAFRRQDSHMTQYGSIQTHDKYESEDRTKTAD
jgi:hypothetical protein